MRIALLGSLLLFGACASNVDTAALPTQPRTLISRRGITICSVQVGKEKFHGYGEDQIEARLMAKNSCSQFYGGPCEKVSCKDISGSERACAVTVTSQRDFFAGYGRTTYDAALMAAKDCMQHSDPGLCQHVTKRTCSATAT